MVQGNGLESVQHAINYISGIFSSSIFSFPLFEEKKQAYTTSILIGIFVLIEWSGREERYAIAKLGHNWKRPLRYSFYYAIIITIFIKIFLFTGQDQQFIYFQF